MFKRMRRFPGPESLVNAAMARLGLTTQRQLVFKLRDAYGVNVEQSSISRYLKGDGGMNYERAMALLAAAGWLNDRVVDAAQRDEVRAQTLAAGRAAEKLGEKQQRSQGGKSRGREAQ